MKTFKQYILEYLTDTQRARYKHIKMTPEAKANTDHFFGTDTDIKHEPLLGNQAEKSEVHKKVEDHLGQTISHEDYRAGVASDKYGRKTKIGKLIKDQDLQKQFVNDNTRTAAKKKDSYNISIVRGIEVAGQTNSAPNKEHPNGHSWGEQSCKNVDTGGNRRYLEHEIRHGSVVVRAHDDSGKEVYRATLHPYHNDQGNTMYAVNSEYGLNHPSFTNHANDVAARLSGEHRGGNPLYKIQPDVYNDRRVDAAIHPTKASDEELHQYLDKGDHDTKMAAAYHPSLKKEHIDKILNNNYNYLIKKAVLSNKNVTPEHITTALQDKNFDIRKAAIKNPNATAEHITTALNDKINVVRHTAIDHPNVNAEHISKALNDDDFLVREKAIKHPKLNSDHVDQVLNSNNLDNKKLILKYPNLTADHITTALKDTNISVRENAIKHSNATTEHITTALNDNNKFVRKAAIEHPNATPEHIEKALNDPDETIRSIAKKRNPE
jgi:hypothetical protein